MGENQKCYSSVTLVSYAESEKTPFSKRTSVAETASDPRLLHPALKRNSLKGKRATLQCHVLVMSTLAPAVCDVDFHRKCLTRPKSQALIG
jgi:hypothetical protein